MSHDYTISPRVAEILANDCRLSAMIESRTAGEAAALNDLRAFFEREARNARDTGTGVFIKLSVVLV